MKVARVKSDRLFELRDSLARPPTEHQALAKLEIQGVRVWVHGDRRLKDRNRLAAAVLAQQQASPGCHHIGTSALQREGLRPSQQCVRTGKRLWGRLIFGAVKIVQKHFS